MPLETLPSEVFSSIIDQALTDSTWGEGLRLRKVNGMSIQVDPRWTGPATDHGLQRCSTARSRRRISIECRSIWVESREDV